MSKIVKDELHRLGIPYKYPISVTGFVEMGKPPFVTRGELKLAIFGSTKLFGIKEMSGVVGTPYYEALVVLRGRDEEIWGKQQHTVRTKVHQ